MDLVAGVDEVGRGCWAGPLVAGAVILRAPIAGLRDSKKLTARQRERLATVIQLEAIAVGLGWVTPLEIDEWGLTEAVRMAMERALQQINQPYQQLIIDGSYNFFPENPLAIALPKADDSVPAVSAASVVAKVARDTYMAAASHDYPDYGFAQHVGYGTQLHAKQLKSLGPCALHRRSYKPVQAALGARA